MHKTITVTIGGSLFVIEEQAYMRLEEYLASVRIHFASFPEHEEIVSDIEDRVAEEFAEKLSARKKTINEKDVEELVKNMGTVEDFEKFEGEGKKHAEEPMHSSSSGQGWTFNPKGKLFRSSDDQVVGGVCAGIANYINIDPWIVRIIFIVLSFMNGVGILIYVIMWAILPEAKTASEKVEMAHGRVTLSAIQQKIEETMPKEKRESLFRKIIAVPVIVVRTIVMTVARVITVVVPFIGRVIGVFMTVGAAIGMAFLLFVTLAVLINPNSPYIGIPVHEIIGGPLLYVLSASLFMLAFVPLLFFVTLGASLMTMRSAFSGQAVIAMVTFWLLAGVATGLTLFTAGPQIEASLEMNRLENVGTVTLQAKDFTEIDVGWDTVLHVSKGPFSVTASGPEAAIRDLAPLVSPTGEFSIGRSSSSNDRCILFCGEHDRLTLDITMPDLRVIRANDVSRVTIDGFSGGEMLLQGTGASRIDASVSPNVLNTDASGITRITLTGKAQALKVVAEGNSRVEALEFPVTDAEVNVNGVSRVMIHATGNIKGTAQGNSRVEYKGNPASVDVEVDSISRVESIESDEQRAYVEEQY